MNKGVQALFLCMIESGKYKSNFEIEVVSNWYNDTRVKMKIDTGADVTAIGENQLPLSAVSISNLKQSKKCLIGPDEHNLECYGCFEPMLKVGNKQITETCYM